MSDDSSDLKDRVARLEKRVGETESRLDQLTSELRKVSSALEPLKTRATITYNRILRIVNAVRQVLAEDDEDP